MSKTQATPSLKASKRAAKAPSAVTVVHPAPQADAPKPAVVPVRGGLAIAQVKLTGKAYRVGAAHNAAWWKQCVDACTNEQGVTSVAALVAAGVPAIFVGYVVRRGYMAPAEAQ